MEKNEKKKPTWSQVCGTVILGILGADVFLSMLPNKEWQLHGHTHTIQLHQPGENPTSIFGKTITSGGLKLS